MEKQTTTEKKGLIHLK